MWRNSLTREGEGSWYNSPTTFRGYGYDNPPSEEKESVNYIVPVERKEPEYKPKVSVDHNCLISSESCLKRLIVTDL